MSVCLPFSLPSSPPLSLSPPPCPLYISFVFPLCMPPNQVGLPELEGVIHNKLERWFLTWKKLVRLSIWGGCWIQKEQCLKKKNYIALIAHELHWNQYRGATGTRRHRCVRRSVPQRLRGAEDVSQTLCTHFESHSKKDVQRLGSAGEQATEITNPSRKRWRDWRV